MRVNVLNFFVVRHITSYVLALISSGFRKTNDLLWHKRPEVNKADYLLKVWKKAFDYPSSLPYFEELHDQNLLNKLIAKLQTPSVPQESKKNTDASHPFIDALNRVGNLSLTDNGAVTNASTSDPCLDLFYAGDRVSDAKELWSFCAKAWSSDPEFTLHLIFYMRSIHRGKSLVPPFLTCYCWLLKNHPRTALENIHVLVDGTIRTNAALRDSLKEKEKKAIAEREGWELTEDEKDREVLERRDFKTHGYWKDLSSLLTVVAQGEIDGPRNGKYTALEWPRMVRDQKAKKEARAARLARYQDRQKMEKEAAVKDREAAMKKCSNERISNKLAAKEKRSKVRQERNQKVIQSLEMNETYRALHISVARLFASQLKKDMDQMRANEKRGEKNKYALGSNLSLASKWAPSLCNSHDKHTFLATSIAEALFPPKTHKDSQETREHYLNRVRDLYRKEYLGPLRKGLDLTEHYMTEGKWESVDYRHIPAVSFQKNMPLFFSHAPESVIDYLEKVSKGVKKVSGETITPNILAYRSSNPSSTKGLEKIIKNMPEAASRLIEAEKNLINGQWNTLIEGLRETSLLDVDKEENSKNKSIDLGECIAVCDVSGSMTWGNGAEENRPYYAAIGLSLVITNLAKPPFNGRVISFASNPVLAPIDTSLSFSEQVQQLMSIDAGISTDLEAVFIKLLLPLAIEYKIKQEDMVKRLFIFTDMQFNEGAEYPEKQFQTTYQYIKTKYADAGYKVPEIVWWNLSGQNTCQSSDITAPVTKEEEGTVMLSGFSSSMLKTFLDGDAENEEETEKEAKTIEVEEIKEEEKEEKKEKDKLTPLGFAKKAAYHESFASLVVVD
ncbi:hypothetical protein BY458DRAFT_531892 [Sporodiniella umbellata]|nr:hypothetical protein BY458DRAFT_531892 [Sporodiniella umbellata]